MSKKLIPLNCNSPDEIRPFNREKVQGFSPICKTAETSCREFEERNNIHNGTGGGGTSAPPDNTNVNIPPCNTCTSIEHQLPAPEPLPTIGCSLCNATKEHDSACPTPLNCFNGASGAMGNPCLPVCFSDSHG